MAPAGAIPANDPGNRLTAMALVMAFSALAGLGLLYLRRLQGQAGCGAQAGLAG